MKCIGIEYNYTMSLEVTVLKGLAADFDGDTKVSNYKEIYNCYYS